jgi:hypothetical protein
MSKKHVVGGRPSLRWDYVDKYIERDIMFVALLPLHLVFRIARLSFLRFVTYMYRFFSAWYISSLSW